VEEHVEARLIVCKLSQEVANRRRAKLECTKTPSAENLALCDWNLYVTNVEEEKHQRMFDIISCSLADRYSNCGKVTAN